MNAEPAAAAGDTDGTELQVEPKTTSSTDIQLNPDASHREAATGETATEVASSDRLKAILEEEGLPEGEVEELTKPKGQPNAKKTETAAGPGVSEGTTGGKTTEDGPAETPKPKAQGPKGKGDEEEEPITAEQAKDLPPWVMPRVKKITAQREAARTEAQQLRERLQSATRPVATATKENPLADVNSPAEMEAAISEYENLLEWAETNPDGLTDVAIGKDAEGNPITRDYSAQEMATIRAKAGRILRQHVPERIQLLRQQHLHEQVAREKLPEMFEEGTEANQFLEAARKEVPGITNIPGFHNWIRWAWMGRSLDIEKNKAEGGGRKAEEVKNGKVDPKVAPFLQRHPPLAPGVPSARVSGDERRGGGKTTPEEVTKAQERVQAGDGEEAEADFIGALRESQSPKKREVLV